MADDPIQRVPINQLRQEDGAQELATSPDMEPHLDFIKALMQNHDPTPELETIRQLPLEKRYVWRVASALKWAFADFDNVNVTADKDTLGEADLGRVLKLLEHRPIQFCLFLSALVGPVEMQRMMVQAIKIAKMDLGSE